MSLKPWREIVLPHPDVLGGAFRQSEFATDITAVRSGEGTREYQEAADFFDRTYLTDGMRWLLTQVLLRLADQDGEPVIPIHAPLGGGKTHSLLAVYHLVTRKCPLTDMIGIPELLRQSGFSDLPRARVVVLDGIAHSPSQHWKHGTRIVRTLWGELAWQLGGAEAFDMVLDADATGTSPAKGILQEFLQAYAPCVILIDDISTYLRQLREGHAQSGGSYESNLAFVQNLVEVVRATPTAMVLASLPEVSVETTSPQEMAVLHALDKIFHRTKVMCKPPTMEEVLEIVRCRLFEPVRDPAAQETVCRAFAKMYEGEADKLPGEIHEGRYLERLNRTHPLHPELFDRIYEDWTTIEGFPCIRGVLRCVAQFVFRLWMSNSRDLMILPGGLPLYDGCSRDSLIRYLPPGWGVVIERDVDGGAAATVELEKTDPRFGLVSAAHRVARTIFLGSAPASVVSGLARGIDRAHVLLGCLQPGQVSSVYLDALGQLTARMHYLNHSSDKSYWFEPPLDLQPRPRESRPVPMSFAPPTAKGATLRATASIPAAAFAELAAALALDPRASVTVTLDIAVEPPHGD